LPGDPTAWRFGLDTFAAAILGNATDIAWPPPRTRIDTGNAVCRILFDSGEVVLAAPVPCTLIRSNDTLRSDPARLIIDPCESGWVAELRITNLGRLTSFLSAADASETIRLDLTRFRHSVALELLSHACAASAATLRSGRTLADVPRLLGATSYLRLLREFVH
jgi:glycine cleavage system H lipoate-binding protein